MNKIILDTHILIWSLIKPEELKENIKHNIQEALDNNSLFISSITLWEISMLINKGRLNLYEPKFKFLNDIQSIKGLNIIEINAGIASESTDLPGGFTGDPADCLIIASARSISGTLITRDQQIISWAHKGFLKLINA